MDRKELLKETELFVLDMDGTFYLDTQILDGSPDNGYAGRGFLLEGSLRCDSRQVGAALGELLEEVTVRRRAELSDFCVLTLG